MRLFQLRCRHLWRVIKQDTQPSGIELLKQAGAENIKGSTDLFARPVIVTYQCAKCAAEKVERV